MARFPLLEGVWERAIERLYRPLRPSPACTVENVPGGANEGNTHPIRAAAARPAAIQNPLKLISSYGPIAGGREYPIGHCSVPSSGPASSGSPSALRTSCLNSKTCVVKSSTTKSQFAREGRAQFRDAFRIGAPKLAFEFVLFEDHALPRSAITFPLRSIASSVSRRFATSKLKLSTVRASAA